MSQNSNPRAILKEIESLKNLVNGIANQDRSTKVAFDTLYKELEQYKGEFVLKMEKSLLLDLLAFFDSLVWFQNTLEEKPDDSQENFSYLMDEFLEVLKRRDVHPYPSSKKFDRKHHRVIQVIQTENEEDDGKIERILRRGFSRGDRTLRDEEVIIHRLSEEAYKKSREKEEAEEAEDFDEPEWTDGDEDGTDEKASGTLKIQSAQTENDADTNKNEVSVSLNVDDNKETADNDSEEQAGE